MPAKPKPARSPYALLRSIRLNPGKLEMLRLAKGWTVDQLVAATGRHNGRVPLDKRTVTRSLQGGEVNYASATVLAHTLGAENLLVVIADDLVPAVGPPHTWGLFAQMFPTVGEWEVVDVLAGHVTTPNGLVYDVCRMRSRASASRWGRGKCYDLNELADRDKLAVRETLLRHADVCDRLAKSRFFPHNYCVTPDDAKNSFWVVDRWIEGRTLAEFMAARPLTATIAKNISRQLLEALTELHAAGVIRRELSPHSILVPDGDDPIVLTDLELAKLTDGRPTVTGQVAWPPDPYRAPEIKARTKFDVRADLYSWARIVVQLHTHQLPPPESEILVLEKTNLPKSVRTTVAACLHVDAQRRPASAAEVAKAISRW